MYNNNLMVLGQDGNTPKKNDNNGGWLSFIGKALSNKKIMIPVGIGIGILFLLILLKRRK